ncbi:MAG: CRTAC1 family protein [Gemmatales bacterium]|nr:CRTAC1 family protein [Gemmatales bacterium]MDW8386202.1 CRTAC1 family protein [Gemmatales bacterium]
MWKHSGWLEIGLTLLPAAVFPVALLIGCNANNTNTTPGVTASKPVETSPQADTPKGPVIFEDVTADSGVDLIYRTGEEAGHLSILESLGGGVGILDYDQDGLMDIFLPGGGYYGPNKEILGAPCKLYRNLGNFKFQDVTKEAGLDGINFYSHGAAVGDFDNDGWPDLLVTGYGRLALFHNRQGKFVDVTEASKVNIPRPLHWSSSAGWADLDGDGLLDLMVVHYVDWSWNNNPPCRDATGERRDVCSPKQFNPLPHNLFLNNGDGTFRDVTQQAGIIPGKGLGVLICDFNHDRKPDIYVANDTEPNYLYLNNSQPGQPRFEEAAARLGVALSEEGVPNGSMGVDAADYDGSGHFSIFVTNYQHEAHALYRNLRPTSFRYVSAPTGIQAIGLIYVGWGTVFIDYDNNGAEDIFISNGHVVRYPPPPGTLKQRPVLLRNLRKPGDRPFDVRFEQVTDQGGPYFRKMSMGRGCAKVDLDNDGRVDLVISRCQEPAVILRNVYPQENHWLGLSLEGAKCKEPIGAEIIVEVGGQKLHRPVKSAGSYASTNDPRIVVGLGKAERIDKLTILWPSGLDQTFSGEALPVDRYWHIKEGDATPKPMAPGKVPSPGS